MYDWGENFYKNVLCMSTHAQIQKFIKADIFDNKNTLIKIIRVLSVYVSDTACPEKISSHAQIFCVVCI